MYRCKNPSRSLPYLRVPFPLLHHQITTTEKVEVMQARVRTWCQGGKEVKYEKGETLLLVEKTDSDQWKVRYGIGVRQK